MAQKTDIIFTIDNDGNITITVENVKGKGCTALTKELEESFGIVVDRQFTQEYYQQAETGRVSIKLGGD
jgi:Protein of unknown function (DUF2997)